MVRSESLAIALRRCLAKGEIIGWESITAIRASESKQSLPIELAKAMMNLIGFKLRPRIGATIDFDDYCSNGAAANITRSLGRRN